MLHIARLEKGRVMAYSFKPELARVSNILQAAHLLTTCFELNIEWKLESVINLRQQYTECIENCPNVWLENNKKGLSLFIPAHINDPIGLVARLWASEQRAARFTLVLTALGIILSPIDWLCSFFARHVRPFKKTCLTSSTILERQQSGPHIFICGPARSGTTLVYQVLADQLDVAFTSNRATLLPRSQRLLIWLAQRGYIKRKPALSDEQLPDTNADYQNYYGKISGFSGPNEANALWNQWVEPDAADYRTVVTLAGMQDAAEYYSLLSMAINKPTLAKNNNANVFANELHRHLPNSYFICMRRGTQFLAESLIRARLEINGDITHSYGVVDTGMLYNCDKDITSVNPYSDVLDQIEYLDELAVHQQLEIGPDRFWIVDYEMFCDNPAGLLDRVRSEILGDTRTYQSIDPIVSSNKITNSKIFERIAAEISHRRTHNRTKKPKRSERPLHQVSNISRQKTALSKQTSLKDSSE